MMKAIASVAYIGFMKPAPGTWGSFAALPLAYMIHQVGGFPLLVMMTAVMTYLGWVATVAVTSLPGADHDPSWVVVDELVGQWIALFPVSFGAMMMGGIEVHRLWPGWIAAFVLFRVFDINKPWLVGRADAKDTAWGVMLDDIWAGIFAAAGVIVLAIAYHKVLM